MLCVEDLSPGTGPQRGGHATDTVIPEAGQGHMKGGGRGLVNAPRNSLKL